MHQGRKSIAFLYTNKQLENEIFKISIYNDNYRIPDINLTKDVMKKMIKYYWKTLTKT